MIAATASTASGDAVPNHPRMTPNGLSVWKPKNAAHQSDATSPGNTASQLPRCSPASTPTRKYRTISPIITFSPIRRSQAGSYAHMVKPSPVTAPHANGTHKSGSGSGG